MIITIITKWCYIRYAFATSVSLITIEFSYFKVIIQRRTYILTGNLFCLSNVCNMSWNADFSTTLLWAHVIMCSSVWIYASMSVDCQGESSASPDAVFSSAWKTGLGDNASNKDASLLRCRFPMQRLQHKFGKVVCLCWWTHLAHSVETKVFPCRSWCLALQSLSWQRSYNTIKGVHSVYFAVKQMYLGAETNAQNETSCHPPCLKARDEESQSRTFQPC